MTSDNTHRTALATLCIGSEFEAYWHKYCARSWRAYAERHGYAIELITEPIDQSLKSQRRTPVWQKCLILSHPRTLAYDRVVWVDADIVINERAPPILDGVPPSKIGAVISGDYLQREMKAVFIERMRGKKVVGDVDEAWRQDQHSWYEKFGVSCSEGRVIQTGVMVLSREHRSLLEAVYARDYPDSLSGFEQIPLSAEILNQGLFHPIDSRFNLVFYERAVVHYPYLVSLDRNDPIFGAAAYLATMAEFSNSFFLHFAYKRHFAEFLNPDVYK